MSSSMRQRSRGRVTRRVIGVALLGALLLSAFLTAATSRSSHYPLAGFLALLPLFAAKQIPSPCRAVCDEYFPGGL